MEELKKFVHEKYGVVSRMLFLWGLTNLVEKEIKRRCDYGRQQVSLWIDAPLRDSMFGIIDEIEHAKEEVISN